MKLATGQIETFLNKPDPAVRVILLYGPDTGLVRERADKLAKKIIADTHDPFRVARFNGSGLSEQPAQLADEMAAQALGGGQRLVWLQHAIESNAGPLGKLLNDLPQNDTLLLIEAGDLDKRSKLRALCESLATEVCAIPCYVEDVAQRGRTVVEILKQEGLTAPRDVVTWLANSLPPDRIAMRSELDKLALYCRGQEQVTLEDIHAVLTHAGAAEIDELIFVTASGNTPQRIITLATHLFAEQTSPVAILRAAQRHFIRLQLARSYCESGLNASEAVKKLQPAVFWKMQNAMTEQVQRWNPGKLAKVLLRLYEAEAAVKRTGTPDTTLTAQLLLQISNLAAAR